MTTDEETGKTTLAVSADSVSSTVSQLTSTVPSAETTAKEAEAVDAQVKLMVDQITQVVIQFENMASPNSQTERKDSARLNEQTQKMSRIIEITSEKLDLVNNVQTKAQQARLLELNKRLERAQIRIQTEPEAR